ncbi:MAG TPA: DUF1080 domain-containing protein [Chthonomonadales bacterium]|nr:DUF1080 domain-containing protein [Chthonomonadales bacterium]
MTSLRRTLIVAAATAVAMTLPARPNAQTPVADADARGWISLFDGTTLTGWRVRNPGAKNAWVAENGVLRNTETGTDLVTERRFGDFDLHVEFNVPRGGNSGVYLQGRYEVQIADSYRQAPSHGGCGAIYSKVLPTENVGKPADDWQAFRISFRQPRLGADGTVTEKARVTVHWNGILVIDRKEVDGVTGGELDRAEGTPGPIMLQGDHGPILYRNIRIRPVPSQPAR